MWMLVFQWFGEKIMKKKTYNFYWEKAILPSIQEIKETLDKDYKASDNYGLTICNLEKHKEDIYTSYDITKNQLKKQFFKLDDKKLMDENLIDIHKIAACFCKSMLDNKIFTFEMKEGIAVKVMLCNYMVAFSASLGIMYLNLLGIYKKEQENFKYNYLKEQKKFVLPLTNEGHDDYFMGRVKTLALNDIYGITFDMLTYSDMMFWIEDYNKKEINFKHQLITNSEE